MEINDMIFKFVYNAALNDATMQQAYSSSKKELIYFRQLESEP